MSTKKLDFESLQKSLETSVNPAKAEVKKPEYGTSYKSQYSQPTDPPPAPKPKPKPKKIPPPPPPRPKPKTPDEKQSAPQNVPDKKEQTQPLQKDLKRSLASKTEPKNEISRSEGKGQLVSGYYIGQDAKSKRKSEDPKTVPPAAPKAEVRKSVPTISPKSENPKTVPATVPKAEVPKTVPPAPPKSENPKTVPPAPPKSENPKTVPATASKADDGKSAPTNVPRARRPTFVKFEDELETLPHHRRSYRDGSIVMNVEDIASILNRRLSGDGDDGEDDQLSEDIPMDDNDPILEQMDNSLDKIRLVNALHEETSKEYQHHRTRFFQIFTLYVFLSILSVLSDALFVYKYNHAFYRSPGVTFAANRSLYVHEECRVYTNIHILLMAGPATQLFALSTLLYRIFSNVNRKLMRWIHGVMNISGSACSYVGVYFAVQCSQLKGLPHLRSFHMVIGCAGLLIQIVALGTGLPFILPFCLTRTRIQISPFHANIGSIQLMTYLGAILTGVVLVSKQYFNHKVFPEFYPYPYEVLDVRAVSLNCIGMLHLFALSVVFYLQTNYVFRHRHKPTSRTKLACESTDLAEHGRKFLKRLSIALEKSEDAPMNSRRSFGAHKRHFSSKSIPILINEAENQKSNFTDMDFLLALE